MYSKVDRLSCHVTQNITESVHREEKTGKDTTSSMKWTCLSNMEVDTNMSNNVNKDNYGGMRLPSDTNDVVSCCNADIEGANLSSEVSAIYLAMKNSKLECIDEHGQDSMSMDVCVEDEDIEEFEEFDPYLFIKSLPNLSSVVPTFRPMLLPKQTRSCPPTTLVLDLDGKNTDKSHLYIIRQFVFFMGINFTNIKKKGIIKPHSYLFLKASSVRCL